MTATRPRRNRPGRFAAALRYWLKLIHASPFVELAARTGYAARGVVYLSVATIALLTVLGWVPHAQGAVGSLEAWTRWPLGVALLWLIGVGLCAFAGWRALQSLFDIERLGHGPGAIGSRAGKAISGLLYGSLGISVFSLLGVARNLYEVDDQAATVSAVQHALTWPFGHHLVIAAGLFLAVAGVGNMIRAVIDHFTRSLDCPPDWAPVIGWLARVGYFARGAAFVPAGVLTMAAGLHGRAGEAIGVGRSLELVLKQPFGHLALALQALGLAAFGAFGLLKGALRKIGPR